MKNLMLKSCLGIFSLVLISGCQRDDICPEATETTPMALIEFYDAEDPGTLKAAQDLVVIAANMEDTLLGPLTTNAIEIPLRTQENFTEYRFILNANSELENEDTLTFSYTPELQYLNRACGFKVNFLNMQVDLSLDNNNWVLSSAVEQVNIENETETHISLTH